MLKIIPVWTPNPANYLAQITPHVEKVIISAPHELMFTCAGGDPDFLLKCVNKCNDLNVPITILTGFSDRFADSPIDLLEHKYKHVTLVQWPTHWFQRTVALMTVGNPLYINTNNGYDLFDDSVNLNVTFDTLFITLNNIAKPHRCLMMDILARQDLMRKGAIAWRDVLRHLDPIRHMIPAGVTDSEYDGYPYQYWKPNRMFLDQAESINIARQEILPVEYKKAFIHLVAETFDELFYITEKTVTPLLFNKPFLILGCRHFHKNLKILGFELYDELFDYSFDDEHDLTIRCNQLIQNIYKYRNLSPSKMKEMLEKIQPKLIKNRKLAISYALNYPDDVKQLLVELENYSNVEHQILSINNTFREKYAN